MGNTFKEICTPDIKGIINRNREKIDQIKIKFLTDFSRLLKKYLLDISKL